MTSTVVAQPTAGGVTAESSCAVVAVAALASSGSQNVNGRNSTSSSKASAIASACFCIIGSALARVARLSAPSTPATARPTTTMKMMSSTSESPADFRSCELRVASCELKGVVEAHSKPNSRLETGNSKLVVDIPGFPLDHDLARGVSGNGAVHGDHHLGACAGLPPGLRGGRRQEAKARPRQRDSAGSCRCDQRRTCAGIVDRRGASGHKTRGDGRRGNADENLFAPGNGRLLRKAHRFSGLVEETARLEPRRANEARNCNRGDQAHEDDRD